MFGAISRQWLPNQQDNYARERDEDYKKRRRVQRRVKRKKRMTATRMRTVVIVIWMMGRIRVTRLVMTVRMKRMN